jgi:hypothetical protein
MKKLSNVSPFLLLLFPVFLMLMVTFAAGDKSTQKEELAVKSNATTTGVIIKATAAFLK